jgi:hypothetical protein
MALDRTTVVCRSDDVNAAHVGEEMVMMRLESDYYYGMDDIGRRVWELLEEPMSAADLSERFMKEYKVSREECEADLLEFLIKLREEGIVRVVERDDP